MEKRIITLEDIIPVYGMADYVAFTIKEEYESKNGHEGYDPIVMYVKKTEEQPNYWFDYAHVAATLAPMSLWDITEQDREFYMTWLKEALSTQQLDILLSTYAKALDYVDYNKEEKLPVEFTFRRELP